MSSLAFAAQNVGATSPIQAFTLTNTLCGATIAPGGSCPLTAASSYGYTLSLAGISIGGTNASSFAQSNTCGATLAPGANCVISVTFDPAASGPLSATLSFADSGSNSPQSIPLTGTETAPVAGLSASSLAFSTQQVVGTTSAAQTVRLTNTGNATLTLTGITVAGANASSFAETNTCGTTLAASAAVTTTNSTPAALYAEASNYEPAFNFLYDR